MLKSNLVRNIAAEFVLAFSQPEQSDQSQPSVVAREIREAFRPVLLDLSGIGVSIYLGSGSSTRSEQQRHNAEREPYFARAQVVRSIFVHYRLKLC